MQRDSAGSAIFDLGYAGYRGPRGERAAVITALYVFSLRSIFGLGRKTSAKIIPFALVAITFLPAAVQLGIGAIANNIVEVFRPEEYYGFINWTLILFVAATSTDLLGKDRRHGILALYFARGLRREDYVFAKAAASTTALLALTLLPQAVLFTGNGLAVEDLPGYVQDNWRDIPSIAVSAVALSAYLSAIGLVVASTTTRRSFAAGAIIGYFAVSGAVAAAAVGFGAGAVKEWSPVISGFHILNGFTYWAFQAEPGAGVVGEAGLALGWYGAALVVVTTACLAILFRTYRRLRL